VTDKASMRCIVSAKAGVGGIWPGAVIRLLCRGGFQTRPRRSPPPHAYAHRRTFDIPRAHDNAFEMECLHGRVHQGGFETRPYEKPWPCIIDGSLARAPRQPKIADG